MEINKLKILLAAPVRQEEKIFNLYLESLRNLNTNLEGLEIEIHKYFKFHNCDLSKLLFEKNNEFFEIIKDDSKYSNTTTHNWNKETLKAVAEMKNDFLDYAMINNYDYIFFVDSDLILHKDTLIDLIKAKVNIIANIFWSKWNINDEIEQPNCWDFDNYSFLSKNRFEELKEKKYHIVGGTGACILLSRNIIEEKFINYTYIPNVSFSTGEDRAFCIRAMASGYKIYISSINPSIHLYRDEDLKIYLNERKNINE